MDAERADLARMLEVAERVLRKHNISRWADWLRKDATLIRQGDFYGMEHLLSAFGGMGSLNDLGLTQPSKHNPKILVSSPDDAEFQSLIGKIYSLATRLAKEQRDREQSA